MVSSVLHFLVGTPLGVTILVVAGLFDLLFIGLVIARRTTKHIIEDLGLAWHGLMVWFVVPFFRLYFWGLQQLGKIVITINSPIPWEEKHLAFVGNHAMPKLQDTFLMPPIIFFSNISKIRNPIRYFPFTMADETNFFSSKFFQWFVGTNFLISVDRTTVGIRRFKSVLKECKKKVVGYSGILIANIEGGRTQSAKKWIESPGGSKLGEPTVGVAILSLESNIPIVPYWGRIVKVSCYRFDPDVLFWRLLEKIFSKQLRGVGFYEDRPKATLVMVFLGLAELLLNPEIRVIIDINHSAGVIRPMAGQENSRQLTERIAQTLLDLGDHQLNKIERSRK
ncbi:MAG: hypothetical protein AAB577_01170 [Patescibacteria group bacterium]